MPVFTASTQVVSSTLDTFISHCLAVEGRELLVASDVNESVVGLWVQSDDTAISKTSKTLGGVSKNYVDMNIMEWLIECVKEGYKVKDYCAEREMFAAIIVNLCAPVASALEAAHAPQGDLLATHLVKDAFKCGKDGEFTMWFKLPVLTDLQYQTKADFIDGKKPNQLGLAEEDKSSDLADPGVDYFSA